MFEQYQLRPLLLSFFRKRDTKSNQKKLADLRNTGSQNHRPYQYALVDVSIADTLHTDPDDTRVRNLFIVDGQRGLRRAAGR